ncbi:MAG: radical SAM/SPASM domain-containing protein [Anaerolineaceae bacterium]
MQATFDPRTPGVTRLHLIPLKTSLFRRYPSVVLINGWYMFLIGPSWADLLRAFINVLNEQAEPGKHLQDDELKPLLDAAVDQMHALYPSIPEETLLDDINEIIGLCIAVAHGEEVPPEIQSEVSLLKLAKHMKAPHRMDLLVSPMIEAGEWQCSLHCKGCYATRQPGMVIDESLSTEKWKVIIDKCREAGIPQVTFTGGEPTQRQDLPELIEYARWHITRLNTNGVNLTIDYTKKLFNANLDAVQITLYSQDDAVHDDLVGCKGAWEKTVQGIRNAVQAGLSVSVNTPLVRGNYDYDQTLKFIKDLGVKYVTCSGLIPTGAAPDQIKSGAALSSDELMEVMRRAVETAGELGLDLLFTSPGWLTQEQLTELGLPKPLCGACLTNMAIMPNGAVTACQSWLDDPNGLGSMLTIPWRDIWNKPACKKMRSIDQDGCPLSEIVTQKVRS